MVAQSRTMPLSSRPPGLPGGAPLPASLPNLPRLLAVVVLTGFVVLIWNWQGPAAPSAGFQDPGITVLGQATAATPTAEITAPQGARLPAPAGAVSPLSDAPSVDLPRLRPNALPRPPELPEPIQPTSFIRVIAQPGDSIYLIGVVHEVPIDEILRFNPALGDGTQISVGQLIFVPEN